MQTLADYLEEKVRFVFEQIDAATASDIYALWLVVALHQDDSLYPELDSFGYSTNAESTTEVVEDYGSRWSSGCIAAYVPLNLCQREVPEWKQAGDTIGVALREQLFAAQNSRFNRSDEETKALWRHAKLQEEFNQGVLAPDDEDELKSLTLRFDPKSDWTQDLRKDAHLFRHQRDADTQGVFVKVLDEVAQRLHRKGVVERVCGQPVPIGISFVNDIDERPLAEVVRAANPEGLSRGIEEYLLGETYEQIEARRILDAEIAKRPDAERVAFWVRALYEANANVYMSLETPLTERLKSCALLHNELALLERLVTYAPLAVPLILDLIEDNVSTAPDAVKDVLGRDEKQVAESMLLPLGHLATHGDRDAISEEDVEQLYGLLVRLWNESETLAAPVIGTSLQVTARVLHTMRPRRFPAVKFGFTGQNGNRLLNYQEFGLSKNNEVS